MKIDSIKDLEAIIKLCRKTGVEHIIVDSIELNLGPAPMVYRKEPFKKAAIKESVERILNPGIAYAPTEESAITTDDLTEEQLLFYSAQGSQ